jgi:endonuclease/exonuclease/phosphatase family metal-dependent hydrolase
MSQLGFIAELLSDHPNAVLMGDFNCLAERPEMQVLYQKTRLQPPGCIVPTFPSWRPDRAIDHILVSSGLQTRTVEAVPAAFSDHLALAMQIDVPADALR